MRLLFVTIILFCVAALGAAQNKTLIPTDAATARSEGSVDSKIVPPAPIKLSSSDQTELENLSQKLSEMEPRIKSAEEKAKEAERTLNAANSFISDYNALYVARVALLNRIAADVVGCKTTEIELGPGGRSVVRVARKMPAATESAGTTSPAPPANKEIKP